MSSEGSPSKFFRFFDYAQASGFAAFAGWTAASMGLQIDVQRKGWSLVISLKDFAGSANDAETYFVALDQAPAKQFFQEMIIGG